MSDEQRVFAFILLSLFSSILAITLPASLVTHHSVLITQYSSLLLDSQSRNCRFVFFRIGIREQSLLKLIEFPNFEVGQVTQDRNIANDAGTPAQQRMNQYATLRIDRRLLAVVVCSVKELSASGIHSGQERKALLDGFPFREGVNADVIAGKTGYVKLAAVFLFD